MDLSPSQTALVQDPLLQNHIKFRASRSSGITREDYGPLVDLPGTWVGSGFNLISLPDFDKGPPSTGPAPFRLVLNSTREILEFHPISGPIPNRGVEELDARGKVTGGQKDIDIFGLRYLQRVTNLETNEGIHIEPGLWLHVPATKLPENATDTIVRQASIPHGTSLLAQGNVIKGPIKSPTPQIDAVDSTPIPVPPTPVFSRGYLNPFLNPHLPPGFKQAYVKNLNLALLDALSDQNAKGQTISSFDVLHVSTGAEGLVNIPFLVKNATAVSMDAIFWVEMIEQKGAPSFLQLQYTQTVILNFLGINWPHISVATLIKQ